MEMEPKEPSEEREFERALFEHRSKSQQAINDLASLAIKRGERHFKHVVYALEKYGMRAGSKSLKLTPLYVMDRMFRDLKAAAAAKHPAASTIQARFRGRFEEKLEGMVPSWIQGASPEQLDIIKRFLLLWKAAAFLNVDMLQALVEAHFPGTPAPPGSGPGRGAGKAPTADSAAAGTSASAPSPATPAPVSSQGQETQARASPRPAAPAVASPRPAPGEIARQPQLVNHTASSQLAGLGSIPPLTPGPAKQPAAGNLLDVFQKGIRPSNTPVPSLSALLSSTTAPATPAAGGAYAPGLGQGGGGYATPAPAPPVDRSKLNFDFLSNPAFMQAATTLSPFPGGQPLQGLTPLSAQPLAPPTAPSFPGAVEYAAPGHPAGYRNGPPAGSAPPKPAPAPPGSWGQTSQPFPPANMRSHATPPPASLSSRGGSLNGLPDECMLPRPDPLVPKDYMRILSRTLFVGAVSEGISKRDLYDLFSSVGRIEYLSLNRDKHNSFMKFKTRAEAELCRSAFQRYAYTDAMGISTQLRVGWGCGFGPRDIFDYASGDTLLPLSRLGEAETRALTVCRRGGGPLQGGTVVEEPETVVHEFPEALAEEGEATAYPGGGAPYPAGRGAMPSASASPASSGTLPGGGPPGARRPGPYPMTGDGPGHGGAPRRSFSAIPSQPPAPAFEDGYPPHRRQQRPPQPPAPSQNTEFW